MSVGQAQEQFHSNVISLSTRKELPKETPKDTLQRHIEEMLDHDGVDKGILSSLYKSLSSALWDQYVEKQVKEAPRI